MWWKDRLLKVVLLFGTAAAGGLSGGLLATRTGLTPEQWAAIVAIPGGLFAIGAVLLPRMDAAAARREDERRRGAKEELRKKLYASLDEAIKRSPDTPRNFHKLVLQPGNELMDVAEEEVRSGKLGSKRESRTLYVFYNS